MFNFCFDCVRFTKWGARHDDKFTGNGIILLTTMLPKDTIYEFTFTTQFLAGVTLIEQTKVLDAASETIEEESQLRR